LHIKGDGNNQPIVVRCSPEFNGNYRYDWVYVDTTSHCAKFPRWTTDQKLMPAQLSCVILGHMTQGQTKPLMWEDPLVIVRPLVLLAGNVGRSCRSFLLRRMEKAYETNGDPSFIVIRIKDIKRQCICFEDFPIPFQEKVGFENDREQFAQKYLSASHPIFKKMRFVKKNWAYVVKDKATWPALFDEMTELGSNVEEGLGLRGYCPPDKE
jgi:hypothetical protein